MGSRGRGGYQQPSKPAAVSGPGALSQRTDGGPSTQAIAAIPAAQYGDRQASVAQQQGAPIQAVTSPAGPPSAPAPQGPMPGELTSLSAPTARPGEHLMTGMPTPAAPADGPGDLLRSIYATSGDESVRELIEAMDEGR